MKKKNKQGASCNDVKPDYRSIATDVVACAGNHEPDVRLIGNVKASDLRNLAEKFLEQNTLEFEYCECGCHCHTADNQGVSYSIFNPLGGKKIRLYRGDHACYGTLLGEYSTFKAAAKAAQDNFDKQLLV